MERGLSMELVRVTEAAALASAAWVGKGQKNLADQSATEAMRTLFDTIPMDGKVVIGEGEIDEAPMLYIGEELGTKDRSEEHTSELQSRFDLVCRLLLERIK